MTDMQSVIREHMEASIAAKRRVLDQLLPVIESAAQAIIGAVRTGNKVLFFGNGGSASDAQHLAAEFVGRYEKERRALPSIALTTDTSILTAVANDYSFDTIFARQIEALGVRGDVAFGISTSGNSKNVNQAILAAKAKGLKTIGLTGRSGGELAKIADITIVIPVERTAHIQECHIAIGHVLCRLVDEAVTAA
jgi:D-sedoheptulose 7-phosphate isomerase